MVVEPLDYTARDRLAPVATNYNENPIFTSEFGKKDRIHSPAKISTISASRFAISLSRLFNKLIF